MFSYRHAFHAGNHADVLKHLVLIAVQRHLGQKPVALSLIDTHAGAGLYRLDGDQAGTSGEAEDGIVKLNQALAGVLQRSDATETIAPLIRDYVEVIAGFNTDGRLRTYPGSPALLLRGLREDARDRLSLFEMHPTDSPLLARTMTGLGGGRHVTVTRQDGFEGLKALLPPPSRRGLVLIDPSYEIKSDYAKVSACLQDSLKRFATGTYLVWYPIIPRPEAHDLPRRLKTLTNQAGKPWLHATLAIGQEPPNRDLAEPGERRRPGLTASGMFVVNPPHTLKAGLQQALPQLVEWLGRGRGQGHTLDSHG